MTVKLDKERQKLHIDDCIKYQYNSVKFILIFIVVR